MIIRIWKGLLNLLFPPKCILCGCVLPRPMGSFCADCRKTVAQNSPQIRMGRNFTSCISPLCYEGIVRESIRRYKFLGMCAYAEGYAALMAESLRGTEQENCQLITWTPVSRRRRRKRGFDQAELITRALAKRLHVPVSATLEKKRHNAAQSSLRDENARRENVKGVYDVLPGCSLNGKRILLVDDIITTGSTLEECSLTLQSAGAVEILCVTLAATPPHHESR